MISILQKPFHHPGPISNGWPLCKSIFFILTPGQARKNIHLFIPILTGCRKNTNRPYKIMQVVAFTINHSLYLSPNHNKTILHEKN